LVEGIGIAEGLTMDYAELQSALTEIGKLVPPASRLTLVGGSALILLGSPRPTMDIDFVGDDIHPNALHSQIKQIAKGLKINVEPVPIERFIPLPKGNEQREIPIGQFGNLNVYVADPYSIALSKVDRGFKADLDDIVFLVQHNHITLKELERILNEALPQAGKYDFHPEILEHFQELKNRLSS
jgi:hypothetical protein